jgi:hypothetical protein
LFLLSLSLSLFLSISISISISISVSSISRCSSATNTQKSLLASVTGCWIMPPEWLQKSAKLNYFEEELQAGGIQHKERVLKGVNYLLSDSFHTVLSPSKVR